jgi:hypothetical protein
MPVSVYFNNYSAKGEQRLYEDLINETIKQWGIDCYYLPRSSESSIDLIFGDDPTKKFSQSYPVEVYVKNVDRFEGSELFSKFGLEIQHQMRFLMTTRSFKSRVPSTYGRPREGDLVWLPNFKALFEIKFVNQEHFFYAFGNQNFYGFELICERFRYSNEKFDSGITEVQDAVNTVATTYKFSLNNNPTYANASYILNETVYQGANANVATATASVVTWDRPKFTLELKDIKGVFASNTRVVGVYSGANYSLNTVDLLNNTNNFLDNNKELGVTVGILDFSETNPFGEPTVVANNAFDMVKFSSDSAPISVDEI